MAHFVKLTFLVTEVSPQAGIHGTNEGTDVILNGTPMHNHFASNSIKRGDKVKEQLCDSFLVRNNHI